MFQWIVIEIATVALRMDDCFANQRDDGGVLGLKALCYSHWNSMVGLGNPQEPQVWLERRVAIYEGQRRGQKSEQRLVNERS